MVSDDNHSISAASKSSSKLIVCVDDPRASLISSIFRLASLYSSATIAATPAPQQKVGCGG